MEFLSLVDYLYGPIVLLVIIVFARIRKYRKLATHPEYEYFTKGLYAKIIGGLSFCFIYALYYGGGDTINYFNDATCMMRLLFHDPSGFYTVMRDGLTPQNYFIFNDITGYPVYGKDDQATFYVVKIATPLVLISAGSLVVSTMLFATISYAGMWKLYKLFIMEFPALKKEMAIAILFIPSVFFWGSGIMKDTITLTCVGFFSYSFYMIFIKRKDFLVNSITIFISTYFILMIKPYIVFALLPGSIIWFVNVKVGAIKNNVIRFLFGPAMFGVAIAGGYLLLVSMSDVLGLYSVDKVLERAVITNMDLKSDYYRGNSFDIGDYDPTISSMLSKAPAAINVALFRPYIWESNNIVMILSGIECFFILLLTIKVLLRVKIFGFIPMLGKNHLLTFALIFSIFFAFSVGISTSNFGSMVRYRIPVYPFFIASLYIINYYYLLNKNKSNFIEVRKTESEDIPKALVT